MDIYSNSGKVAVVTGGTRGLGLSIANNLADSGAEVIAASRNPDPNRKRITGIFWDQVDVTDPQSIQELMERTARKFGGPDIVVANAGIRIDGRITQLSLDDWKAVLNTNLTGTLNTIRAAAEVMQGQGGGRIITVSSCMADNPAVGTAAYAASKAGIEVLTKAAAQELAPDILVSSIAPGIVNTGMGEAVADNPRLWDRYRPHLALGRPVKAEEIGRLVAFMAGPDGAALNGATIRADGGIAPWA